MTLYCICSSLFPTVIFSNQHIFCPTPIIIKKYSWPLECKERINYGLFKRMVLSVLGAICHRTGVMPQ